MFLNKRVAPCVFLGVLDPALLPLSPKGQSYHQGCSPTLKGLKKTGKQSRQKELQGKVGSQIRERQNSRPEKTPLFSRAATAPPDPHPLVSGKNVGFCIKV